MIVRLASCLVLTTLLLAAAQQRPPDPSPTPARTIGVRNAHAMAYDRARSRVVLFGGADESRVRDDTWEWDGARWSATDSAGGPGPRTFPAMAYDSVRRSVVLFGGNRVLFGTNPDYDMFLGDTWTLDALGWTERRVAGPPPRAEAAMAFDVARGRVVLFGGRRRGPGGEVRLADTWEWDGRGWTEARIAGPSPRCGAAAAYDSVRRVVVLFGGSTYGAVSGETWEWDGLRWTLNRAAPTEPRFNPVMAFDVARGTVVRFGGRYAGKPVGDTWDYDGRRWRRVSTIGPSPRNHAAMAYDASRRQVVLFGGHDLGVRQDETNVFGDTWEWDGSHWSQCDSVSPRPRVENGH